MIYFDNAATSWPKPPEVLERMSYYFHKVGGSPGRSGHRLSTESARLVFETRELLSILFNIEVPQQIAFTKNITEALNFGLLTLLKAGDHVITTSMEHNSVMRPLRYLENTGVKVTVVPCNLLGQCNPKDIEEAIKTNTKMIVVNHSSNVTGTIQPLDEIGKITNNHKIIFTVDAAQTAGYQEIDVQKMHIDLLTFTGHKGLLGPQGTGGIYINPEFDIPPLLFGGTGSHSEFETQPNYMPDKLESGTLNTIGIIGLGAGVRFILETGIDTIKKYKEELTQNFINELHGYPAVKVYGPLIAQEQTAVVSINIENMVCSEVGSILDKFFNIMTRTGLHCAPTAHKTIKTAPQGTVRFSFGFFNTKEEVLTGVTAVKQIADRSRE